MHHGSVAQLGIEHYSKDLIGDNAVIGIKDKTGNRKRLASIRTLLAAAAMLVVTVCLYSQTASSGSAEATSAQGAVHKMEPAVAMVVSNSEPIRVLIQIVEEETGSRAQGLGEGGSDAVALGREQTMSESFDGSDISITYKPV